MNKKLNQEDRCTLCNEEIPLGQIKYGLMVYEYAGPEDVADIDVFHEENGYCSARCALEHTISLEEERQKSND